VLTVGLMATATALTGLVPPYAKIGIAAPILLVLCRLVQGFSTGGEWGGAAAFLVEHAPAGKRGIVGSMQQFSVGLALVMGTAMAAIPQLDARQAGDDRLGLARPLYPRLPAGADRLLSPLAGGRDAPAYDRTVAEHKVAAAPVRDSLTTYIRPVLAAFGLSIVGTVGNYIFNIFVPSFATSGLGIPASTAYYSTAVGAVILTILTPVFGALSDQVGRKAVLLVSALGYVLISYPLFMVVVGMKSGLG